jgi:hypothetical protein
MAALQVHTSRRMALASPGFPPTDVTGSFHETIAAGEDSLQPITRPMDCYE